METPRMSPATAMRILILEGLKSESESLHKPAMTVAIGLGSRVVKDLIHEVMLSKRQRHRLRLLSVIGEIGLCDDPLDMQNLLILAARDKDPLVCEAARAAYVLVSRFDPRKSGELREPTVQSIPEAANSQPGGCGGDPELATTESLPRNVDPGTPQSSEAG